MEDKKELREIVRKIQKWAKENPDKLIKLGDYGLESTNGFCLMDVIESMPVGEE